MPRDARWSGSQRRGSRASAALARATLLTVALAAITASPVHALVLDEDPLAETSTELGVIARSFAFVLLGDPLVPPADPLGMTVLDLRAYVGARSPAWTLVIHGGVTTTVRSHDAGAAGDLGRSTSPPRWLPLRADLTDQPTLAVRAAVDWAYVAWSGGPVTVTIGRQPVTMGRGALWRPMDLIGTFALTEVDTEYKPGADAARVDWSVAGGTSVTVVATTGELDREDGDGDAQLGATAIVARVTHGFARGEAGALAGYVRGDGVAGADVTVDAGGCELYAEATLTYVTDRSIASPIVAPGDVAAKLVAGATFRPRSTLVVRPELLFNGFGATDPARYPLVGASGRVRIGEQITLARSYASIIADWEVHPLVHITGLSLANLDDASALASVGVRYSVSDNVRAVAGAYVGVAGQDDDEFAMLPALTFFEIEAVL